jgi:alanyl-tRNA synthetase
MTAQDIRQAYLDFMVEKGHVIIPRAQLVPQNDPTTLFTGSGMQPLLPYLLGEQHPGGGRVSDSQPCLRTEDIDEVGDNRHTCFFEMLGNWSFGEYFKQEQLSWFFEFLTEKIGIDPNKLYVTCFIGDESAGLPKDTDSAEIWQTLFTQKGVGSKIVELGSVESGGKTGLQDGRIFYYDAKKNWWSRAGTPSEMPAGEPGGPDSELFYEFTQLEHDKKYGEHCHPNCDCGRFMEVGNSVFMEYLKKPDGSFEPLPKKNVDFGGGLERFAAAAQDNPDIFTISLLRPIVEALEALSGKNYAQHTIAMRVIADHLRAATFLAIDGIEPSNKRQGYVMRRLIRRAIRYSFDLGIEQGVCEQIAPVIIDIYKDSYPEVANRGEAVVNILTKEEKIFRQTLRKGLHEFEKMMKIGTLPSVLPAPVGLKVLNGNDIFMLYDTFGFPVELSKEEAFKRGLPLSDAVDKEFDKLMEEQRQRSQTAAQGTFKGGLADSSELTTKYHTAAHLVMQALRDVLGDHVAQKGSNITAERLRLDFSHPEKVTPEQITQVEKIVNEKIEADLPVVCTEHDTKQAMADGTQGVFGDKYGDKVKVYSIGDPSAGSGQAYSKEICGGPHIEHTGQLAEGGMDSTGSPSKKKFKITKEESSSAGVRRIKAILQ